MHFAISLLLMQSDQEQALRAAMAMMAIVPIIMLVVLAVIMVPFWFILKKAGFSPWLTLLNAVPLGNIILLYIVAFSEWKVMPVPQYSMQPPPYPPVYPPQA